jgi:hypothetical protein
MKAVIKSELLTRLEDRVESHISQTLLHLQNRSDTFLNRPSDTGGWSIAQCLDHLNSYGNYYLPKMRHSLCNAPDEILDTFSGTWLGAYFTGMMDPATGKKKFRAVKGHIPPSTLDAAVVIAEFVSQQEEMLALLRSARSKNLDTIRIPVSIVPFLKLRIGNVFQFMIAHNERHIQQAMRNLTRAKSYQD